MDMSEMGSVELLSHRLVQDVCRQNANQQLFPLDKGKAYQL